MIKQILAALTIASICLSPVFAFNKNGEIPVITRYIKIITPVKKIIIYGDAEIIFTKAGSDEVMIKEVAGNFTSVKPADSEGLMEIHSKEYYNGKRPVIYIPVQELEELKMYGDGSITTTSVFKAKQLNVFIHGVCEISIRSLGKVNIDSSPEFYLDYKKNEVKKVSANLF